MIDKDRTVGDVWQTDSRIRAGAAIIYSGASVSSDPPSKWEYAQPAAMGLASLANVLGGIGAIVVGADRTINGINPFFYIAMATSAVYVAANAIKVGQIYQEQKKTWVEIENDRRNNTELTEIVIER